MRVSIVFAGIIILMFCLSSAMAETHVSSNVQCTGECTVTQIHNGESVQVSSSNSLAVNTTANDNKVNMTINAQGEGTVTLNLSKNDSAFTINADDSGAEENESGALCNSSEICNSTDNSAGDSARDSYDENAANKTIETTVDGNTETVGTDGIFQKIYHFFESFTARIFW